MHSRTTLERSPQSQETTPDRQTGASANKEPMVRRNFVVATTALAALLMTAVQAWPGGQPAPGSTVGDQSPSIPFDLTDPNRVEAGKARFHSTCADFCHGHEPVLFVGRKLEPAYAHQVIVNGGRGATPMPAWGDVFSDEEIWELVAYLQYLGEQKPK